MSLTGNVKSALKTQHGRFAQTRQIDCHYFAIDGGSGAHLLAALSGRHPEIKQVASPRHANLLLVIEPINRKLAPAVGELAGALPRPAHVLIVGEPKDEHNHFPGNDIVRVEELFPSSHRIALTPVESVFEAILHSEQWPELEKIEQPAGEEATIQLPAKQEQEMATELAVLSLGPVQPFTAGPLRLLLICDGEQVLSAQVEAGYASRGIAGAMTRVDWQQALHLARRLDPLAPIASQLAYVRAVEQLQGWQPASQVAKVREAALAIERAQNALWWLVRYTYILAEAALTSRAYQLASKLAGDSIQCWQQAPSTWVLPQQQVPFSVVAGNIEAMARLREIATEVEALRVDIERNRLFALRTRDIGVLATERLKEAGVSGPNLRGSEHGAGDVQSRLLARLDAAIGDLREAHKVLEAGESAPAHAASWDVPAGEAHVIVRGPRGDIGLHLVSAGGEQPAQVEWHRPSAVLLPLLPEILAGEILADAEVIVASLDLAMAEADG